MSEATEQRCIRIMEAMVAAQEAMDWEAAGELMAEECTWQAMMLPPVSGREAVAAAFQAIPNMRSIKFLMRNVAANGSVVFFERDDVVDIDGSEITIPVVGVMEFEGEKIKHWREYFDFKIVEETLAAQSASLDIS